MPTVQSDTAPGRLNLILVQGVDFRKTLTLEDGNGAPIDLTGCTAALKIRDANDAVLASLADGSGLTLGGPAGTIGVVILAAATKALPAARDHWYDLIYATAASPPVTSGAVAGAVEVRRGASGRP